MRKGKIRIISRMGRDRKLKRREGGSVERG